MSTQTGCYLVAKIDSATGQFPRSVRKEFQCGESYWESGGYSEVTGHRYLSLIALGCSKKTPAELMSRIKANLGSVFPFGAVGLSGNQSVYVGNVFRLLKFRGVDVYVEAVDLWSFTLRTKDIHPLAGVARHGIIKDSAGELWLLQQGLGESGEWWVQILLAYKGAPFMWSKMAQNIQRLYL